MKTIMFYTPMFYLGGTEIAILNLVGELAKMKDAKVYIGYTDDKSDMALLDRYRPYAEVVKVTDETDFNVDILVVCSTALNAFNLSKIVKRKETFLWLHYFSSDFSKTVLSSEDHLKKIDKIIAVSNYTKNELIRLDSTGLVEDKISVIYNLIDTNNIFTLANEACPVELCNGLNFVTVSRLCHKKGFGRIRLLADELIKNNIDFKWFIVGGSFFEETVKEITDSFEDIKEYFHFTGFIDNPFPIIKNCDYLALLSDSETWGLSITEAKILNVPCISTDFEAAFEQIEDNVNGVIISREDTDSYKDKIKTIIENHDKFKNSLNDFIYSNDEIIESWKEIISG